MTSERVSISVADGIADVRLNRPEKLNAIDPAMFAALAAASADIAKRGDVRAVVLSGSGRAFCAGLDVGSLGGSGGSGSADGGAADGGGIPADITERTHGAANLFQQAVWGWRELPVPVIAAVTGVAFGGGLQIALAADVRIVAPDAQLAVMEARWGLVPDMAGFVLMRGLVRDDVARELTYTARKVSGTEAVTLGLATRTADDPLAAAFDLAREIAGRSPRAVRAAKRLFAVAADAPADQILLEESREQQVLLSGPDIAETLTAQLEGRPPKFADAG
jgi:enoyl-CoA hydratase/carnithine racemase